MSRPLRIEFPGAWYHVMNRGAGRKHIFRQPDHRNVFHDLLGETYSLYGWEIHAYCLMDNHYHLLIHTPRGNLGRAMRHLNGLYTQRFNRSMKTDGPLFRGRYKAILVDANNYLLQVSRYIHRNPLEANQSQNMHDPLWTSYPSYLARKKIAEWFVTSRILDLVGNRNSRSLYRNYVKEDNDDETTRFYSKGRLSPILGDDRFIEGIESLLKKQALSPEIAEARIIRKPPSIDKIVCVCAEYFQLSREELFRSRRGVFSLPRNTVLYLCRTVGGHGLKEIADEFGSLGYSAVAKAVSRLNTIIEKDKNISQHISNITDILKCEGN